MRPEGDSTGVDALQGVLIRPGQPMLWVLLNPPAVVLEAGEIVEGSGSVKPAGVDKTHEQVADLGSMFGLEKQGVFAVKNGHL